MQPMDTAPLDGRVIRLHMPSGMSFLAKPVDGLVGDDGGDCWNWGIADDDQPCPDDWDDGICWGSNADGVPSTCPIGWSDVALHPPQDSDDNPHPQETGPEQPG